MVKHVKPGKYLEVLRSPATTSGKLEYRENELVCSQSGNAHPIRNQIIEFVEISQLTGEKARELEGNTIGLNPETVELYANKHTWSALYTHFTEQKIQRLLKFLKPLNCKRLVALGCGTGYELRYLLKQNLDVETIFASDLSYSMLNVVPQTLKDFDVELCLFTSDLDQCPVQATDIPVLIYEALHHTEDMHATIEHLMSRGYQNILFVEPTSNVVMRALEKFGLARRVEYSGVKPDRLILPKLKTLCQEFGYQMSRQSVWEVPEDYFRKVCPWKGVPQSLLLGALRAFGGLTSFFLSGNTSIVQLRKTTSVAQGQAHQPRSQEEKKAA